MSSLPKTEKAIQFHEIGDITGMPYTGKFTVKTILTQREQFLADQNRRFILGPSPEMALNLFVESSYIYGQLSVRIAEAPEWWNPNGALVGGMELLDTNIAPALYKMVSEAEQDWLKEVSEMSKQADKVLKKSAAKKIDPVE